MPLIGSMGGAGAASTALSGARSVANAFSSFRGLGMAMRFVVLIGSQQNLGEWTSCEGLKVDFKFEEIHSGGDYGHSYAMPQTVSFSPVTLRRAVERGKSDAVQAWLQQVAAEWSDGTGRPYQGSSVTIELHDITGLVAASWELSNAFPSSWSGPQLSAKGSEVATETLVLTHSGFLEPTQ
jgi:phage tail-like protein